MSRALTKPRMRLAEFARRVFTINPEAGITLEDVKKPEYWAHVSRELEPMTRLEVIPEDEAWYAELLVRRVLPTAAVVTVIQYVELSTAVAEVPDNDYEVMWGGPVNKYQIKRKSDNALVGKGFASKDEANAALIEHRKAFA